MSAIRTAIAAQKHLPRFVLKRGIEAKAAQEHRSLSAQVEHELTEALRKETVRGPAKAGKLLGRFAGGKVPSDDDFIETRCT